MLLAGLVWHLVSPGVVAGQQPATVRATARILPVTAVVTPDLVAAVWDGRPGVCSPVACGRAGPPASGRPALRAGLATVRAGRECAAPSAACRPVVSVEYLAN
jgi:hypothetical protein